MRTSDVSRTFPDREIPGKFHKSHSREIFLYSREFREIECSKFEATLGKFRSAFAPL